MKRNHALRPVTLMLCLAMIFGCLVTGGCSQKNNDPLQFYTVSELKKAEDGPMKAIRNKLELLDEYSDTDLVCVVMTAAKGDIEIPAGHDGTAVTIVTSQYECTEVTSLTVSEGVRFVDSLFKQSSTDSNTALTSVTLPDDIVIETSFLGCEGLKTVKAGRVKSINQSFNGSGIEEFTAEDDPENNLKVRWSFITCPDLKSFTAGNLGDIEHSFISCGLEKIKLRFSEEIDESFKNCENLTTAEMPSAVTVKTSFRDCPALESVKGASRVETIDDSFTGCGSLSSVDKLDSIVSINSSFKECPKIADLSFISEINEIKYSFRSCNGISALSIGDIMLIENSFEDCPALTNITLNSDNTDPERSLSVKYSFKKCPALKELELKNTGKIIDSFSDLNSLTNVNIDTAKYTEIDYEHRFVIDASFNNDSSLASLKITGDIYDVINSFDKCPKLDTVEMDSVEKYDTSFTDSGKGYEAYLARAEAEKERLRKEEEEQIRQAEERAKEEQRKRKEEEQRKLHEQYDDEPYGPGTSGLSLSADSDRAACFRLVKMNGDTEFMVFLEAGESTTQYFPSGRYTLKVARGEEWISDEEAFGSSGYYSTTDVFTFESGGVYEISTGTRGDFRSDSASGFLG